MSVQDYIDHVLNALPKWFSRQDRTFENVKAFAEIFQRAEDQSDFWRTQANILDAVDAIAGQPDWLNQHAVDRGTRRQDGETDAALQDRLRTFPDALILSTLLDSAQSVVDAEGIVGTVVMIELRGNRAFMLSRASQTGAGGEFTGTAPDMLFEPDAGFSPLEPKYGKTSSHKLVVSGAASAGNDGTFPITGISDDSVTLTNGSGVAEVDATVSWSIVRYDVDDNVLDGFRHSYLSRGYRMGDSIPTLVVILPFGCTDATRLSVVESLRQKKGAGVSIVVECRANP